MVQILRRIQNVLLTIFSLLFSLIRGTATRQNVCSSFVIIYPTGNIGDMVCTTPVFRAIKKNNPKAHVTVIGTSKCEEILRYNKDVDSYIHVTQNALPLIFKLRKLKFDAGVVINLDTTNVATLFLGGVKSISCFSFSVYDSFAEPLPYKFISRLVYSLTYKPGTYVPQQNLNLLKPFGIYEIDTQKYLSYSQTAEKKIGTIFKTLNNGLSRTAVAISPGAGTKIKQWPAKRFGQVANYVSEKYGVFIIIVGGPGDIQESEDMISTLHPSVHYRNFVGQSLDELKATLSKVALIIGNDSGPIYIAESFGVATLVLVGPTDEAEHPLQDETHRVVLPKNRERALLQSVLNDEDNIDQPLARSLIESITVEQVCLEIDDLFIKLKIEPRT